MSKFTIARLMEDFSCMAHAMNRREINIHYYPPFIRLFLPLLKIKRGYQLDIYQLGDDHAGIYKPYVCRTDAKENYVPVRYPNGQPARKFREDFIDHFLHSDKEMPERIHQPYKDSYLILDAIEFGHNEDIPSPLNYFSIPFSEDGIAQAWLLHNLSEFLPHIWHSCYGCKTFAFTDDSINWNRIEKIPDEDFLVDKEELLQKEKSSFFPLITILDDTATIDYHYWNEWKGLVKARQVAKRVGESIEFGEPEINVLVKYNCGVKF